MHATIPQPLTAAQAARGRKCPLCGAAAAQAVPGASRPVTTWPATSTPTPRAS